ncbi:transcription factor IIIC subunit delta N-term-domain-containing protein [Aspergillus avenaceus]|uniref:Transcription factor IIIC subunit delta N-term-domain-containing protein n=1 Tax=Aspergillus avenaceus TaxID=36643 RepID=A0A5N6U2S6_ASPAV|nr:transcription factor IIIC subunit delta N-term-domain-containing protein [Aspergillus avenaceus]
MLAPTELQLFPSCYNCISWSSDGEVAIAAGEYVQILTPKQNEKPSTPNNTWTNTRFKANVFTNKEWATIWPQTRDNFSLGPEQSLSTVVGLAWSPPGLAKHRRCVLAVLTSNLLLSFWDIGPQGRWSRVAIVNHALGSYFSGEKGEEMKLRKAGIRSFTWCPPLKVPGPEEPATPYSVLGAESRWGLWFLGVANDDNDVVVLRVDAGYSFAVVGLGSVSEGGAGAGAGASVFATAVASRVKAGFMAAGPWVYLPAADRRGICAAVSNLGIVCGSRLRVVRCVATLTLEDEETGSPVYKAACELVENPMGELVDERHFTTPLQWLYSDGAPEIWLAAGTFAGLTVLRFSYAAYEGQEKGGRVRVQELPFYEATEEDEDRRHWEPTSAMTVAWDEGAQKPVLHVGTVGGYTASMALQDSVELGLPSWRKQLDNIREQFDIARDLGGFTIARTWGLASHRGLVVAAITVHPGDTIEYRTSAEERTTLVFSHTNTQYDEESLGLPQSAPDCSPDSMRRQREAVLGYILFFENGDYSKSPWSRKLIYAAACCTVVDSQNPKLLSQAQLAVEWLASDAQIDLDDEIAKCSAPGNTIKAKSVEQLGDSERRIYEQCEICDAGIPWDSAKEAQCTNGHLFVRCGMTFLAIQEPGISKFCSHCGMEYLSEDLVHTVQGGELERACRNLSDAFDTCIYCGGKFQA